MTRAELHPTETAHWASRGFIVVAADHPGIGLKDLLGGVFGGHPIADAKLLLDALAKPEGEIAFLAGKIAQDRLALSGHSAGGGAIAGFGDRPGVKVLIPMAAQGVKAGAALQSTLILGAMDDGIASYSGQVSGYGSSPKKKRLVGLTNAGHLAFSDLCAIGKAQGGILQVAVDHGIVVNPLIATLAKDGCKPVVPSLPEHWPQKQAGPPAEQPPIPRPISPAATDHRGSSRGESAEVSRPMIEGLATRPPARP